MDPITIIIDVYPASSSKAATVVVAATHKDGTPHFASGSFADRHKLLDQAYGEAAKRAVKADARKASKPKGGKSGKAGKAGRPKDVSVKSGEEPEGDPADEFPPREPDQIGPDADNQGTATPLVDVPADLPVIEGDGEAQLELTLEGGDE